MKSTLGEEKISLYLSAKLRARIEEQAKRESVNRCELIRRALEAYVQKGGAA